MQIPSNDIRPLAQGESVRDDEVELDAEQAARVQSIRFEQEMNGIRRDVEQRAREDELARRPHMSKGSRKRGRHG